MNIEEICKSLNDIDAETVREIADNIGEAISELNTLDDDIRKSLLEIDRITVMVINLETTIKESIVTATEDGKKKYPNAESRDVAYKQELAVNDKYQNTLKEKTKWQDELNKTKLERELKKEHLKFYYLIGKLMVAFRS